MGEDLDLSWRSQVAGARVVVAPEARVRHREVEAAGRCRWWRWPTAGARKHPVTPAGPAAAPRAAHRAEVLRLVPSAPRAAPGGPAGRWRGGGGRAGPGPAAGAGRGRAPGRWNARHRAELGPLRRELKAHRLFPDAEVRRLQLHGSARLSGYLTRLTHQGFEAANAVRSSHAGAGAHPRPGRGARAHRAAWAWPSARTPTSTTWTTWATARAGTASAARCAGPPSRAAGPGPSPWWWPPPWSCWAPASSSSARCPWWASWPRCRAGRPPGTTSSRAGSRPGWGRRRRPRRPSAWPGWSARCSSAAWAWPRRCCCSGASRSGPSACPA